MAGNAAFTLQGANPLANAPTKPASPFGMAPKPSPVASALSSVSSGISPRGGTQFAPPTPSTPLKSTTLNNVDGSSVTHTYHAPEKTQPGMTTGLTEQNVKDNLTKGGYGGMINNTQTKPVVGTTGSPDLTGTNPANPNPTPEITYKGLIGDALTRQNKLAEYDRNLKQAGLDVAAEPGYLANIQSARQSQISQAGSAERARLATEAQNALTAAGLVPESLRYDVGGSGTSALNPLNNVSSIAQQVINGQVAPSQAYGMGGSLPNWQGLLNAEIQKQKPGFDTAKAEGSYSAKQQNVTTSGTAPVNAAATSYGKTYNDLLDLNNTTQNVDQFGNLLLQSMKVTNPDGTVTTINPFDAKYANATLAGIRDQLSSSQQAVFDNTFASLKSRVSGLLAMGGSEIPTQITADANKIIDGSLPLSSLSAVLQRITTEGKILTGNLQNKLNTAGGVIGAPATGQNNNPAGI